MEIITSRRIRSIQPSATLSISAKANALKAKGVDIIDLSVGEPDFITPAPICTAAIEAIRAGHTHYTPVDGIAELKTAIVKKFERDNQLHYAEKQILVSCGAKQSLYNIMQAFINPGDEVLIPTPYWVSYPAQVLLAEGIPRFVETTQANHFKLTPTLLDQALTSHTRALIINSPSNPSGMSYSLEELKALSEVLLQYPQLLIISDDIYEHLLWKEGGFHNLVNACPALYDRTVVVNGVSKAYAMTGWRIGFLAGPVSLVSAMKNIQSHATSGPSSIAQYAAFAALSGDQNNLNDLRHVYQKRETIVYTALSQMPGIQAWPSDGTFYQFPHIQTACARLKLEDDIAFCEALLEKTQIAAVPGSAFGTPNHVRFSYATSEDLLSEAMNRLQNFLTTFY